MQEVVRLAKAELLQGSQQESNSVTIKQETISNDLEPNQIEANTESGGDIREKDEESGSATRCQTPVNEELWVVRKQLCRGCHSDGAFWSLQITTEGVAYGDLLQTYFNIQLCPVSRDELALSAICALCAARLREARAFSAQARAAEERFTRFYKQNRVRVLANKEEIKENVTIVKNEVVSDDDSEITSEPGPETVYPNLNDEFETDVGESEPVNPNLTMDCWVWDLTRCRTGSQAADGEVWTEKSTLFTLLNEKKTRVQRKRTPKKSIPKEVLIEEGTPKIDNEAIPKEVLIEEGTPKIVNEAIPKEVLIEEGTPKIIKKVNVSTLDYEHETGGFICARCENVFNTLHSIGYHVKHVHLQHLKNKSKEVFQLSPSDYKFIRDIYKCKRCDKQYHIRSEMYQHIKQTHLKPISCTHCDETFKSRGLLTKHKFLEHSIDDRIKCNACDWFAYEGKHKLTNHMAAFHKLGELRTCPNCDYVCFTKIDLSKHAVKHSTVRKHHCKYCKKSFLRKTTLVTHEKIHTEDKRKVCDVCGQAFVQRASLTYHMAKHHPEVRF